MFLLLQEYNRKLNKDADCTTRVHISFRRESITIAQITVMAVNDRHNCYKLAAS